MILMSSLAGGLMKLSELGFSMWNVILEKAINFGNVIFGLGTNLSPALLSVGFIVGRNIGILVVCGGLISRMKLNFIPNKKFKFLATFIYSDLNNGYDAWAPNNNTNFKTYSDDNGLDSQTSYGYSLRSNFYGQYDFTLISSFTKTDLVHSYDSDWGDSLYWANNHDWRSYGIRCMKNI